MNNEMTMGKWLLTLLITCIPCIGIIMLFVWAFGNGDYPARKTWAQAQLVFALIVGIISFIISMICGAAITALISSTAGLIAL